MRKIKGQAARWVLYCLVLGAVTGTGLGQFGATGEILRPDIESLVAVEEKDGYVYTLNTEGTLRTYDLREHTEAQGFQSYTDPIDTQELSRFSSALHVVDSFLYVMGGQFDVFSLANPASPLLVNSLVGPSAQSTLQEAGYLIGAGGSLRVRSLADPSLPEVVNSVDLAQGSAWAVGGGGGVLYVSTFDFQGQTSGIAILDFTDPPNLEPVGFVETEDVPYRLNAVGALLVDCWGGQVSFWSLADPLHPSLIVGRPLAGPAGGRGCVVYDRYLVTNGEVFDVEAPFDRLGTFPPGGSHGNGFPYGSIRRPDLVYLAYSDRILLLKPPPSAALPQYANGEAGGFQNRSRVILENSGQAELSGKVTFLRPQGTAAPAGTEETPPDPVAFALPPLGSFEFSTDGTGPLQAGPAEVRLDGFGSRDLQVTLIYELLGSFVSVSQAGLGREHSTYVTRNDEENTAIAIFNPSPADTAQYQVTLLDDQGIQQGSAVAGSLSPGEQKAIFVTDIFEQIPANFSGRLLLEVINDKPIYSLAIIQRTDGALLSVATLVKS